MKAIASKAVLAVLAVTQQISSVAAVQPTAVQPIAPVPLTVALSTDKHQYQVGEKVQFTRTLTNQGRADLSIYPFAYMNANVRFYWVNGESLMTRKYGDGKCGFAPPKTVEPGKSLTEMLSDNVMTEEPGTYLVFVSSELPSGARLETNVVTIEVVKAGKN